MIRYFQTRFALSEKGAKDFRKGVVFSTLLNLAFMLPATYLFFFLMRIRQLSIASGFTSFWRVCLRV